MTMTKEEVEKLRFLLTELRDCESSLYHGDIDRAGNRLKEAMVTLQRIIQTNQT